MTPIMRRIIGMMGVRRTYATWNPADKDASITLSGGDLTAVGSSVGSVRATIGKSTGKWYWEVTVNSASSMSVGVGKSGGAITNLPGNDANSWGYQNNGNILNSGGALATVASYTTPNVLGFAYDGDAATIAFYKNNILQDTQAVTAGTYFPMAGWNANYTANFGATAFTYPPPGGYNSGLYV